MDLAILDGAVVPAAEARIPVTDAGLLRGDGVFEAVRLYGGRPFALGEHLERMARSAQGLRLPLDAADVAADAAALLDVARPGDAILRLVATRGGHRLGLLEPLPDAPPAIALGIVEYQPTCILDGIKSLSYAANMLASRLARERGCDEALLVTVDGRVLEGPTSSFFAVLDDRLVTPPLPEHVLDSITRRRVLAATDAVERALSVDDLRHASAAFLASTTREVQPVARIEEIEVDPGHPLVEQAASRTAELIAAELAPAASA